MEAVESWGNPYNVPWSEAVGTSRNPYDTPCFVDDEKEIAIKMRFDTVIQLVCSHGQWCSSGSWLEKELGFLPKQSHSFGISIKIAGNTEFLILL